MAIPGFQDLMLPLLQIAGDAQEHHIRDVIDALADYFQLTEDERREQLPSGKQPTIDNRVHWARTYLAKAGLIANTVRGKFQITERGINILSKRPDRIDRKFLEQFEEFIEFRNKTSQPEAIETFVQQEEHTPEETLQTGYVSLTRKLAQDLLERVKLCSPQFFEQLVVDLLLAMGYGGSRKDAGEAVGQSGDGGIDGIIKEDRLGLSQIYIQAKRWEGTVGQSELRNFVGALEDKRANRGVFITTSQFSSGAKDYAGRIQKNIILIDGEQLAEFMIEYGVGVIVKETYVVKEPDENYFSEE